MLHNAEPRNLHCSPNRRIVLVIKLLARRRSRVRCDDNTRTILKNSKEIKLFIVIKFLFIHFKFLGLRRFNL
jgi:hypothetical protein